METMRHVILAVVMCFLSLPSFASESQLKEGNRQFKKGNYDKALKLYDDALIDQPYSSVLQFNAGDAAYQLGDTLRAENAFKEAAKSSHPLLKGAAHYNQGNTLFRKGQYADAVEAYKDSLRTNPRDEDAKYNLGLALEAVKNPPKSCPNPKSGPGPKKDEKKDARGSGKTGAGEKQPKPGQMSKEDAERLLAAAGAGEKKKGNQRAVKPEIPKPDEDW